MMECLNVETYICHCGYWHSVEQKTSNPSGEPHSNYDTSTASQRTLIALHASCSAAAEIFGGDGDESAMLLLLIGGGRRGFKVWTDGYNLHSGLLQSQQLGNGSAACTRMHAHTV